MDPVQRWSDLKTALVAHSETTHGTDATKGAQRMIVTATDAQAWLTLATEAEAFVAKR